MECEEQNSHPLPLEVQTGLEPRWAYREWLLDEQRSPSCPETATFAGRDLIWESASRTSTSAHGPRARMDARLPHGDLDPARAPAAALPVDCGSEHPSSTRQMLVPPGRHEC